MCYDYSGTVEGFTSANPYVYNQAGTETLSEVFYLEGVTAAEITAKITPLIGNYNVNAVAAAEETTEEVATEDGEAEYGDEEYGDEDAGK